MIIGRKGFRINSDWTFTRDDEHPDVVTDIVTESNDYYNDIDFAEGAEQDFDQSLQAKLAGHIVRVNADPRPFETPNRVDKLLWKWGSLFDFEIVARNQSYLNGASLTKEFILDAPYNAADGYGNMGINLLRGLKRAGLDVYTSDNWKVQNRLDDLPNDILESISRGFGGTKPIGIRLSQPDSAVSCPSNYKINWSMWEFPVMPEHWATGANQADLCFVPCGWNKQLWREGDVHTPTVVVPLGFDPKVFYPITEMDRKKNKKVFTFYTDGSILGGNTLFQIWQDRFADRTDLELIVKFPYHTEQKSSGNMRVINERVSVDVMRDLYHAADCFLYPTQAEGFGLFPLEAMATGLTVVATRLETMYSMVTPDNSIPINVSSVDWFHKPDMEQFAEVMEVVAKHKWDMTDEIGQKAADYAHAYWTWDHTVARILRVLGA